MQPYFFPYLGYWQLIKAVDKYVIYDDVNYIKGGWINRNHILCHHQAHLLTLPLEGASPNKKINQIHISSQQYDIHKIEKTLQYCYSRAPYFDHVFPLIQRILVFKDNNLSRYLQHSLHLILDYLLINTQIFVSSELDIDADSHGEDRVIEVCQRLRGNCYINAIGGQSLYDKTRFSEQGIELCFSRMKSIQYRQFGSAFVPNLSIIDILMFNAPEQINQMLDAYELL